jgi:hypothetical protein
MDPASQAAPVDANAVRRGRRKKFALLFLAGLIVGALILLLEPRTGIDPRLIGTWKTIASTVPSGVTHEMEFRADGVFLETQFLYGAPLGARPIRHWWSAKNSVITLRNDPSALASKRDRIWEFFERLYSGRPPQPVESFRVLSVDGDVLKLEYTGVRRFPAPTYTLQRIR